MSVPAPGKLIPISRINESHIGEKLRLFGILRLADDDRTSTVGILCSLTGNGRRAGILLDLSVPIIEVNEANSGLLLESGIMVMAMGALEQAHNMDGTLPFNLEKIGIVVDKTLILRTMLLRDAGNIDLRIVEEALAQRYEFDLQGGVSGV